MGSYFRLNADEINDQEIELSTDTKEKMYQFLISDYLKAGLGKGRQQYVSQHLFPKDFASFEKFWTENISARKREGTDTAERPSPPILYGRPPSLAWLKENADCVDTKSTIYPDVSSVRGAGHGAFASRDFAANERILIVPVLPIPEETMLDYYQSASMTNDQKQHHETEQKQLMYNYCYGHNESSMLLFPVGVGVNLINHQPLESTLGGPNVKLRWLSSDDPNSRERQLTKNHHLIEQMHPFEVLLNLFQPRGENPSVYMGMPAVGGLIMEVVAKRDIHEGEELFLDYGTEWQVAWDTHMSLSKNVVPSAKQAVHWNHEYVSRPFPSSYDEDTGEKYIFWDSDRVILKAFAPFNDQEPFLDSDRTVLSIVLEEATDDPEATNDPWQSSWSYTIKILNPHFGRHPEEPEHLEMSGIPHSHIFFVDKPGASEWYAADAFRHPIGIDFFPDAWKNIK